MEIFIHIIMLMGGLLVWAGLLLVVGILIYVLTLSTIETFTGRSLVPGHVPWVRRFRNFIVLVWVVLAFITSIYYGMMVDVQLNPMVWHKEFYTEE